MRALSQILGCFILGALLIGFGALMESLVDQANDPTPRGAAFNTQDIIRGSSVKLEVEYGTGSATIGYYRGRFLVLTAGHCLEKVGEKATVVLHRAGQDYTLQINCLATDKALDLAIGGITDGLPPFVYPDLTPADRLDEGEGFIQYHYPLDFERILTRGQVLNPRVKSWKMWECCLSYVSGEAAPGSSGSALWVSRGLDYRLAGVLVGGHPHFGHSAKVAIHTSCIRKFLDSYVNH